MQFNLGSFGMVLSRIILAMGSYVKVDSYILLWFMLSILSSVMAEPLTDSVNIDVLCDTSGMHVHVRFEIPFKGAIYSKGYQNTTSCRYLTPQRTISDFTFYIPLSRCGTLTLPKGSVLHQVNTVVFQTDPVLQTSMDYVRTLSCDSTSLKKKAVTPESTSGSPDYVNTTEKSFRIWMEIKRGTNPFSWSKEIGSIKVGDEMLVIIHIHNTGYKYPARIVNCEARDEPENENATVVKLLDSFGCPLQPQIFSSFEFYQMSNARDILAVSRMTAFRFSERKRIFLSCGVEMCRNYCPITCYNTTLSSSHSKAMPKSEFLKLPLVTSKFAGDDMNPKLGERKSAFNASAARRVMQDTIDALFSSLKPGRRNRRLDLQTRGNSFSKRRYAQLNEYVTEESELTAKSAIRTIESALNSEDKLLSTYGNSHHSVVSEPSLQNFHPTTRNVPLANTYRRKLVNDASSSAESTNHLSSIQDETIPHKITVTKGLSILPADVVMDIENLYSHESQSCFSPVKLTVVISCLLFLVLCLFMACILLTLKIKQMNRNNAISRFLLYPYS